MFLFFSCVCWLQLFWLASNFFGDFLHEYAVQVGTEAKGISTHAMTFQMASHLRMLNMRLHGCLWDDVEPCLAMHSQLLE